MHMHAGTHTDRKGGANRKHLEHEDSNWGDKKGSDLD